LNTDICKFEPSQKDESIAQSADSSKEYRKASAVAPDRDAIHDTQG